MLRASIYAMKVMKFFLTQVVKEESQYILNKTMTMDDNFDFNLGTESDRDEPPCDEKEEFCSELSEM